MDMKRNVTVDELLMIWVKHTHKILKKINVTQEIFDGQLKINKTLDICGVTSISILQINKETYKLRYIHRGNQIEKVVPLIA